MYLEKLEIQGFKSFANKNILVFPGPSKENRQGLTAIVGPNGSGKSNVADAVRWVLGEQSMKTLRGKKSEDVIFSGSMTKSKQSLAEVSLHLNNEDGSSLIDYSQVVLTRRVFRDGNSEYLINNSKVRLLDVQLLLARANFGQKTYSVIGQGMVEGFLNTSLSERKEFFDEATGIKQFQIKRDESLNKLLSSTENLGQVEMLTNEIEPRLRSLTKQVNKLKKRDELEKELKNNQLKYYRKNWHEINDKFSENNNKFLEIEKNKTGKDKKIEVLKIEIEKTEQQKSINQEFSDLQNQLFEKQTKKNNLIKQIKLIEAWLEAKKEVVNNSQLSSLNKDKERIIKELNIIEEKIINFKKEEKKSAVNDWQIDLRNLKADREVLIKEINRHEAYLEMKLESLGKFDLSFLTNRKSDLHKELARVIEEIKETEESLEKNKNNLTKLNLDKESLDHKINELNLELKELNSHDQNKTVTKFNDQLENSLKKLQLAEDERDLEKIKLILKDIREELNGILLFSTGREAQEKLANLQKILNEIFTKRSELIDEINEERFKINSYLEKIKILTREKDKRSLELISIEKKLYKGQEKFDASLAKKEISELEAKEKKLSLEINELSEKIRLSSEAREKVKNDLYKLESEKQNLQTSLNRINGQLNDIKLMATKNEVRLDDLEKEIRNFTDFKSESITEKELIETENNFNKDIVNLEKEINNLKRSLDEFNLEQEKKHTYFINLQKNLQLLQVETEAMSKELNELKILAVRQETKLEDLEMEIRQSFGNLQEIKEALTTTEKEEIVDNNEILNLISNLKKQLDLIGGIDPEVEKEYNETKERYDFLFNQSKDLKETANSLESIIRDLDLTIKDKFDKEFKVISEKFQEYFKILFSGGEAKIIKVTAEEIKDEIEENNEVSANNILQKKIKFLQKYNATGFAGIEIIATPPGKKIKSVTMLSGGERALTAIALICAIISANPSPFVVLDEVDAALDESNSERLAKILDDLSYKTQFIVITHNRAAMRRANILYGVTMQEDGTSKLLSVKLEDVKIK